MKKTKRVRFYAEIGGKLFWLRPLWKYEDACKGCAIATLKCDCDKQKEVPCDGIYFDLDEIHDGNYKIENLPADAVRRVRKIANAAWVSRKFYQEGKRK